MELSEYSRMREINEAPEFAEAKGRLISGGDFFSGENGEMTLRQLQEKNPTWDCGDILSGLRRLQQLAEGGGQLVHAVYPDEEIKQKPRLDGVRLFFMPAGQGLPAVQEKHQPYAILLAGGAYGAVCTMVEALPVAAKLNELGITCFCLNYRTATAENFATGLLPQPLVDLAAALRFIGQNEAAFGVDAENYIAGGFSAGGHVASLWGTEHLGARHYGLPQPKMLMLAYPLVTAENIPDGPMKQMMCTGMFGASYTQDDIRRYDAARHVDAEYPKTYLVRSADDTTVPPQDADDFVSVLKAAGVPCRSEQGPSGGHGFGLGTKTPLDGWVERAAAFLHEDGEGARYERA